MQDFFRNVDNANHIFVLGVKRAEVEIILEQIYEGHIDHSNFERPSFVNAVKLMKISTPPFDSYLVPDFETNMPNAPPPSPERFQDEPSKSKEASIMLTNGEPAVQEDIKGSAIKKRRVTFCGSTRSKKSLPPQTMVRIPPSMIEMYRIEKFLFCKFCKKQYQLIYALDRHEKICKSNLAIVPEEASLII